MCVNYFTHISVYMNPKGKIKMTPAITKLTALVFDFMVCMLYENLMSFMTLNILTETRCEASFNSNHPNSVFTTYLSFQCCN